MASNKNSKISLTTSESISLPTNDSDKMAISTREWQRLRKLVDGMTDNARKWELALTSSFSVFLAFILPVFSTPPTNADGAASWLFMFYLSITVFALAGSIFSFLAMQSHKGVDVLSKKSVLDHMDEVTSLYEEGSSESVGEVELNDGESLYEDAVKIARDAGKVSTSFLQRKMRIGYGRAARLVERMEDEGIASASDGARPRKILK
jgi:hypothetical protein